MAYRKIYNQVGVFAGICPSTGYHFMDYSGNFVNSTYCNITGLTGFSNNLIYSLNRVNDVKYSFAESRIDIKDLGDYGTIARPTITIPPISLDISYYSMGLINESILGFVLSSGNNITPISGFLDRTFQFPIYRDCKNIFIATNDSPSDLNLINSTIQNLNGTTGNILNSNIHVYAFGDCYLDTYKYSASVGNFPQVSTSFTCYNVMYYSGGSGNNIPSLNPKDSSLRSGIVYNLPPFFTGKECTSIRPGDITLNITENGSNNLTNYPVSFTDIKIQQFDIDLNLGREPLQNLGYRLPLDRRINPPIYANLSFSAIVGDSSTGSFINFINNDEIYNVLINLNYSQNQIITGTAISFNFLGIKFNNIQISESIADKKIATFSLTSELNPNYNNVGFFISGSLGTLNNYLLY